MTSFQFKTPKLLALAAAVVVSFASFSAITTQFQHAGDRDACLTRLADTRWGGQNKAMVASVASSAAPSAAIAVPRTAAVPSVVLSIDATADNDAKVAQSNTKRLSAKL